MRLGLCVSEGEIVRREIRRSNCFCSYSLEIFKKVSTSLLHASKRMYCLGLALPKKAPTSRALFGGGLAVFQRSINLAFGVALF